MVADYIADSGFVVYVPKVLQPAVNGGTHGDGLPADFNIGSQMEEFQAGAKKWNWDAVGPKVDALLSIAKKDGAVDIGVIGTCWGAWAAFKASAVHKEIRA